MEGSFVRLVALDPGGTTGVAEYVAGRINAWQLDVPLHHKNLYNYLDNHRPEKVICESFTYRRMDKVDLIPVEYIGVARLWCIQTGTPLVLQTPSQAKKFFDDTKVKGVGLWQPGQPHANDAIRHLLYFLTFTIKDPNYLRLLQHPSPQSGRQS